LRGAIGGAVAVALVVAGAFGLVVDPAAAQPQVIVVSGQDRHAGEFIIPINKSQVLRLDVPLKDLLVGNAEIADVLALTDRSVYVLGKSIGSTSLTLYGADKQLIAVLDLVVSYDIDGLKAKLFEVMPEENIEVRVAGGSLMLSGIVSGSSQLSHAMDIASRYAGGDGNITNLLSVQGSQQVMLQVRFAEVQRGFSRDIDFNFNILNDDFFFLSGSAAPSAQAFGNAGTIDTSLGGGTRMDLFFDALEGKGHARTLAEPNLTALSGDTASFLAGGEFPIPVPQDDSVVTIEFKEFGISLAFTPTVLGDGLINLSVSIEESAIDQTRTPAIIEGFIIPSLLTRRADTTVEVRDGQSFAIAGLLKNDFTDTISQFPGLGDLPVVGALFRSTGFNRQETELVILVTPRLVQPSPAGALTTPADTFIPPTDTDLFLFGRMEAPGSGMGTNVSNASAFEAQSAGGIDGAYGHIVK
jgi:pilus assembly protein CpaC